MRTYAVVMAAGKGTRMKSDKPKVVHEVLYKPMINHIVDELKQVGVDEIYVIVGHKANEVEKLEGEIYEENNYQILKYNINKEEKVIKLFIVDSLEDTVKIAYKEAQPKEVVLFSPASASFDMFKDFMERGEKFKSLVNDIPE